MTAFDGTNTATCSLQIIVDDPNVQWAGNATLCVRQSVAGDFVGCPGGSDQATDASFNNVINARASNGNTYKRILFRRGDSFNSPASATISVSGPGLVGAYGAGAAPVIAGTSGV